MIVRCRAHETIRNGECGKHTLTLINQNHLSGEDADSLSLKIHVP
jgi:hypothetical protein